MRTPVERAEKRVTLVHHSGSGWGSVSESDVVDRLARAGHAVRVVDVRRGCDDDDLRTASDVVIAAGGDGTLLGVARRLAHGSTPMVVFPVGTANNLARTIGARSDLDQLIRTLEAPRERWLDLGVASGSWGERYFCESVGVGWFCDALDSGLDKHDKAIDRALQRLAAVIAGYTPRWWTITIDGRDLSGAYTFVDVMNARMAGPNLCLAPDADPFDGWLDVVLATHDDRGRVHQYVDALRIDHQAPAPAFAVLRAKHVRFALRTEERIRVDGTLCPKREAPGSHFADVSVLPSAVKVWLPEA